MFGGRNFSADALDEPVTLVLGEDQREWLKRQPKPAKKPKAATDAKAAGPAPTASAPAAAPTTAPTKRKTWEIPAPAAKLSADVEPEDDGT